MNWWRWFRKPQRRTCYLYRIYGRAGTLLYIGISVDPNRRIQEHHRDQPWSWRIHHVEVQKFPSVAQAMAMEKKEILTKRPKYNVVHNRRRQSLWKRIWL